MRSLMRLPVRLLTIALLLQVAMCGNKGPLTHPDSYHPAAATLVWSR